MTEVVSAALHIRAKGTEVKVRRADDAMEDGQVCLAILKMTAAEADAIMGNARLRLQICMGFKHTLETGNDIPADRVEPVVARLGDQIQNYARAMRVRLAETGEMPSTET